MGSPNPPTGISNELLSSTLRSLKDEALNQLFVAKPLLRFAKEKGKIKYVVGSSYYDVPATLTKHTGIVQLDNGFERIDTTASDVMDFSSYRFCDFTSAVNIARTEELANRGDKYAVVDIAKARMEQVMEDMAQEWEKQILAGTSTVLTNLQSFMGLDGKAAGDTGWFEGGALLPFGSQGNDVGTLSKSTYASSNWQNQTVDAGGALSLDDLHDLHIEASLYNPRGEMDCIIGSPNFWKTYRGLLGDLERYSSKDDLDGGRPTLMYAGARVYASPFLPVTGAGGANVASAYFLNMSNIEIVFDKDGDFKLHDFKTLDEYAVRRALIHVRTLIAANHLASQGLLVNAEA